MNSVTYRMFVFTNWYIQTIIAQTFWPGYNEGGTSYQGKKIRIPDQEKGG